MLRKRTRSHQKDHLMGHLNPDVASESYFQNELLADEHKNTSFFNVPGLFVGFHIKSSECDSVRSPTSPLDFRAFSNLGSPFRSPKASQVGNHHKMWDHNKVGLSIVDSLDYETEKSGKALRASDSKTILFGPQMRIKIPNSHKGTVLFESPKSLPKGVGIFPSANSKPSNLQKGSSDVLFHIGESPFDLNSEGNFRPCSLDSVRPASHLSRFANQNLNQGSGNFALENGKDPLIPVSHYNIGSVPVKSSHAEQFSDPASVVNSLIDTISPREIELSEDYTCVRKHGPNPKVTHIFGDCILKCHDDEFANFDKYNKLGAPSAYSAECAKVPASYPSSDFLSLCYSCKKKLDGEDIYMYR
ncbi:OLC1v1030113C3 [Oldenlandia corymbosa var. corymbosa]|nr:OLC1v1030113C3 [Oldenlandia corymbosa var. corymbosa]